MSHLHIALVNEHPERTLIPLLQLRPERIVLVACRRGQQAAERLRILLQHELPEAHEIRLHEGLPQGDPQRIAELALALADELASQQREVPPLEVTCDLAGGDRLTALLFQQAMRHCDADCLHLDPERDVIHRLGPTLDPHSLQRLPITAVLTADLILQAHGRKRIRAASDGAEWRETVISRRPLTRFLAHQAPRIAALLVELKGLLAPSPEAAGRAADPSHLLTHTPPFPETDALQRLSEAGLIGWSQQQPRTLSVATPAAADYLTGGWLGEYAWLSARDAGLQRACGEAHVLDLSGRHNDEPTVFDCLAVHRNRPLILECLARPDDDAAVLHRLYELAEHGDELGATRVVLSDAPLGSAGQRESHLRRAQRLGVAVLEGDELTRLPASLKQWMDSGRWPAG
ncbi:DUF1887 family protein [Halomonas campisalis]|uniref:DUF1887 family protein n=1 Tax=Billgrantia campisalis TaxID=74661 RepID=A0ABS9PC87_9GAMM|nr:DUF1887 family CARF protein [Halomonas campisalis]MCG6659390.1 DUF1887 family protein [Halomonas campisalis]MDR5863992.1 DUF1887 family CARF protein [Halomonas campisalis]